jgi:hypothetical protein
MLHGPDEESSEHAAPAASTTTTTPTAKEVAWNDQLEGIVSREGEKAACLNWLHNECEIKYSRLNTCIALPVIILSTLSGTFSVASASLFGESEEANAVIGFVTIGVGILSTIQGFFAWAKRQEAHRITALNYAKLHRYLTIELSLPRETRTPAKHLIKFVREQVDRLSEISPIVPNDIIGRFNTLFGDTTPDITKPAITNGLEPIEVYKFNAADAVTSPHYVALHVREPEPETATVTVSDHK